MRFGKIYIEPSDTNHTKFDLALLRYINFVQTPESTKHKKYSIRNVAPQRGFRPLHTVECHVGCTALEGDWETQRKNQLTPTDKFKGGRSYIRLLKDTQMYPIRAIKVKDFELNIFCSKSFRSEPNFMRFHVK